jgi:hypothetical protein
MPQPQVRVLYVFDVDPESARREPVAEAAYEVQGRLRLVRADALYEAHLQRVFDRLNQMPALTVAIPPPASAKRYELYNRTVERSDTEFFQALRDHLLKYYSLRLSFERSPAD